MGLILIAHEQVLLFGWVTQAAKPREEPLSNELRALVTKLLHVIRKIVGEPNPKARKLRLTAKPKHKAGRRLELCAQCICAQGYGLLLSDQTWDPLCYL